MTSIAFLGFILLVVGPIVIALVFGGRLLDRVERKRAAQQRRRRSQTTRALPLKTESIDALLETEISRDELDRRVTQALESFRALSTRQPTPIEVSENTLKEVEQAILQRESHFVTYLDLAQVQSEIIEILHHEVSLLRDMAEIRTNTFAPRATPPESPDSNTDDDPGPGDRLRSSIEEAVKRREHADRKMRDLRAPGGSFDVTTEDNVSESNSARNR